MDQNKTTEVMCTDRPDSSQADDQSHVLSESRKDLSSETTVLGVRGRGGRGGGGGRRWWDTQQEFG